MLALAWLLVLRKQWQKDCKSKASGHADNLLIGSSEDRKDSKWVRTECCPY